MGKVTYNNNYIRPAPSVSISSSPNRAGRGDNLSTTFGITLRGVLLPTKGSPTSSGTFSNYGPDFCEAIEESGWAPSINAKIAALRTLFNTDHQELAIGMVGKSPELRCYPRLVSFDTDDSYHLTDCRYTAVFEADNLYAGTSPIIPTGQDQLVKSYDETWDISFSDEEVVSSSGENRVFSVSHSISAVGKYNIDASGNVLSTPYDSARVFVCARAGDNAIQPETCINGLDVYTDKYNHIASHSPDVAGGGYSITESWIFTTGLFIEDYTINEEESEDVACPTVTIDGTITGYATRTDGVITAGNDKYSRAKSQHDYMVSITGYLARAEDVTGIDLDPIVINSSVGRNVNSGTISYSYTYKKRPFRRLALAKRERISISNNWEEDVLAITTVLDRGDIIQKINGIGYKAHRTTLSLEATYPCGTGINPLGPRFTDGYGDEIQDVIDYFHPINYPGVNPLSIGVESQTENWDEVDQNYDYNVTWVWQLSGICE